MPYNLWHQNCVFIQKNFPMAQSFILRLWYIAFLILLSSIAFSQKSLPDIPIKDLKGQTLSSNKLIESSQPTIISFWATWCKPCLQEINAINEHLEEWKQETNVKFIAISVDDSRSKARVSTYVHSKKWQFDVFTDENGDFQRALNVLNVPHTIILDAKGKIIFQHTSYASGDEEEYIEVIRRLKK